ncbi:SDR family oxidoreductase [Aphanothece sacrum]|uniref:AerF protein n=1 Tax=Aphanothece sacrum FPU1 TaxID=1920663 RepID=A0A401IGC5_APHSA|nr:SDR family oxidoreductase [Aphanothece sacrum]GBF80266.1 AerF protein [Aphanothece sacrum FPU1]GBF83671.1 AerF protein [Aphanothece sacrum FPU3]
MDLGLTKKIALVTGASAGIGFAIAEQMAKEGCHLIICGRHSKNLEKAHQALLNFQGEIMSVIADVQQESDSRNLVQKALEKFGKIDILINNSEGASFSGDLIENISDEAWKNTFEGKLMGYIRMTNLVLPSMKNQQWGRIINVIGTSGKEPSSRLIKSGVANAGLINFTKALATEVAKFNILVTGINPGIIDTPRHRQYLEINANKQGTTIDFIREKIIKNIPIERIGNSHEIANLVTFLSSECASYITGVTIPVDGGLSTAAF